MSMEEPTHIVSPGWVEMLESEAAKGDGLVVGSEGEMIAVAAAVESGIPRSGRDFQAEWKNLILDFHGASLPRPSSLGRCSAQNARAMIAARYFDLVCEMKDNAYNHRLRLVESAKDRGIKPIARLFAITVPTVRKWLRRLDAINLAVNGNSIPDATGDSSPSAPTEETLEEVVVRDWTNLSTDAIKKKKISVPGCTDALNRAAESGRI
jgi:hypothetical protein